MNLSAWKALTWGTVVAAVLSALLLAALEFDSGHDTEANDLGGLSLPGATTSP